MIISPGSSIYMYMKLQSVQNQQKTTVTEAVSLEWIHLEVEETIKRYKHENFKVLKYLGSLLGQVILSNYSKQLVDWDYYNSEKYCNSIRRK